MRADKFKEGRAYADANLLYMFLRHQEQHQDIVNRFMSQVIEGYVELYVSPLALDEALYRLLLAHVKEIYGEHPLTILRRDSIEPLQRVSDKICQVLRQVLQLPHVQMVNITSEDSWRMLDNTEQYILMPRDALHLAVMQRLALHDIISDDADFDRVPDLQRHWMLHPPT